ncbi:hypothetical protein FNV43_RR24579 [Rhamnella rubrinervis]|uniref:Uncharacterized protein n=1 Tax=Rhamnella rubrinervis TaxID=2594499 RepID=A0A8K0DYC8_9ROSA|nr:hypothetical protein FNV43_RR24579 [Rhamnella rubrinervis]
MMFMGFEISSSSIEVMPNGIGTIPHAEQAEISHPAPAAGQLPIEGLLESQWVTDRENKVADLICELQKEGKWIVTCCCTPVAGNLRALGVQI